MTKQRPLDAPTHWATENSVAYTDQYGHLHIRRTTLAEYQRAFGFKPSVRALDRLNAEDLKIVNAYLEKEMR